MASAMYEMTALALALLPASQRNRSKVFAGYAMEWNPIQGSAASINASFTIDSQTDFVALTVIGNATDQSAPPVNDGNLTALLNLKVADRLIFDKPVAWTAFVGANANQFPLPFPLWCSKASTVTGILTNLNTANRVVRLTFYGFLLMNFDKTQSRGY